MASAIGSPLLHCLQQLNDDVWAGVLLPKLILAKSASAVAASCSALRSLCHGSIRKLNLAPAGTSGRSTAVKRQLAALHHHFPDCTDVKVTLAQDSCYLLAPAIMEGLSRLSCLCTLELTVEGALNSLALGMALSSINTQLQHLRSLALTAKHSWSGAQAVWEQLGEATQLTHLAIGFGRAVDVGGHIKDLAPLSALTGLQRLTFQLANSAPQLQLEGIDSSDAQFLGQLTAMTELCGDFVLKPGMLEHISSCTALQSLLLPAGSIVVRPSSSDWQGVGQLTRLTQLGVARSMLWDQDPQPFYSALQHLTNLHIIAGYWTWGVLPSLAVLTKLTSVYGEWTAGNHGSGSDGVCEQVLLVRASGSVPFRAFPNVEIVALAGSLDAPSWAALGSYCPKVKKIVHWPSACPAWPSFPAAGTCADRVAALKGLAQLTGLTRLAFNISRKLEVVAIADAMQHATGLRRLALVLCSGRGLDWGCLLPLGKLTSLTTAQLAIRVRLVSKDDAHMLLSGFAHVCSVTLTVNAADVAAVEEAVQESRTMGLELPECVKVERLPA